MFTFFLAGSYEERQQFCPRGCPDTQFIHITLAMNACSLKPTDDNAVVILPGAPADIVEMLLYHRRFINHQPANDPRRTNPECFPETKC